MKSLSPQWLMSLGFAFAILTGAFLLTLPIASADNRIMSPVTAFFTATSATCVTGLSVIDIGTELTLFGQLVVLALIQLGGLGITTFGTFLLVLLGRRLSVRNESVLMSSYGTEETSNLRSLLHWTIGFTFLFEGVGAVLLWSRYLVHAPDLHLPPGHWAPAYYAVFHSISAFCNAGFSLHRDNLIPFQTDPFYLGVIDLLIIFGGLGFLVLHNLITTKFWRRNLMTRGRVSLHSKIALSATLLLIAAGALVFLCAEWNNTLKDLPLLDKFTCSIFHSVTPRTAGFNAVDMGQIKESTRLVTNLLMLVGGSPGSAAGGVKTTTMVVLIMTVFAMCKGRGETVICSRTVPADVVREAHVIFLLALAFIATAFAVLLWTEAPLKPDDASQLLFETVSASATVGLSINHTPMLSTAGRLVIIVCMYIGRLGPLTVALLIGAREEGRRIRYPQEEIVVG
ncbi:MAG TPA: potassium transporter TrkG [Kiritimatiellia bacterium]|nr:potassium transporter TrkG [Kiritimatiellia bacterium]HPS07199.1 potassium transporter TrkG [Kiritimatiellia bacterium]